MKPDSFKLILGVILALVITFTCNGQSFLTNGLVAYYPFNGNAHDASGNGNDGVAAGAVLRADRFGNPNSAYNFNGLNNYIIFNSPPTIQIDNLSLSAWVNPASISQGGMAVCMGYDDKNTGDGFEMGMDLGVGVGNHFSGFLGGVTFIDSGSVFPAPNVWYHIVMLRRDGVTRFYLNGNQTPNTSSSTPYPPSAFTIGSATGARFFNEAIDDVRIYNRALSDAEVQQLYQIESPAVVPPHVDIKKAVYLTFTNLTVGSPYQLQVSSDLNNWTNFGSLFQATTNSLTYTNYWNIDNWNQLFFRLH
jgi:hypothetical protein